MKKISYIFLCSLTLCLTSFSTDSNLESEKFSNFLTAITNNSTFSYFTVIKVKNVNSGETKEICTKGNFVSGALHTELGADYDTRGEQIVLNFAKKSKDRYFEFKNKKALNNVSFFDYEPNQLAKIQMKYNLEKTIEVIKKKKKFELKIPEKEMITFAHLLFNKGYMTGENDCFGGTIIYVDRNRTEK